MSKLEAEVNKLELNNQLVRTWEKLLPAYVEDEMRAPSSAKHLLAIFFVRTAGQLMFMWSLAGVALEALTSYDKLKLGDSACVSNADAAYCSRQFGIESGEEEKCHLFLEMDHVVIPDATIQACYQCAAGGKSLEKRVSSVILNVYQGTGIEKEVGSRQSLENHAKLDEIRWLSNKKFEESHDVQRWLALAEDYSRYNGDIIQPLPGCESRSCLYEF